MEKKLEIVLSTRNLSKIEQIRRLIEMDGITLLSLNDLRIEGDVVEDGNTLRENAEKKALFGHDKTGKWCVAEDTGLYIDALNGAPGLHAKRWAGENKTTEEIRDFTLEKLSKTPWYKRNAVFKTVAVVVSPQREIFSSKEGWMEKFFHPLGQNLNPTCPTVESMYPMVLTRSGRKCLWAKKMP